MGFRKQLQNSAPFAIRVLWVSFIAGPTFWLVSSAIKLVEMTSTEAASWVQAFGSIGAIVGAFAVANWQAQKQQLHLDQQKLDRLQAMHAVVQSAAEHAKSMGDFAKDRPPDFALIGFWTTGLGGPFQAALQALKAIPVHELGHAALVVQCMSIIGAMTQMQADVEHYLSEQPSMELTVDTYSKVDLQVKLVAFSWGKYAEHAGLSISSPGSC